MRALFFQGALVAGLLWAIITIAKNTAHNMEERGIKIGLHFFDDIAPFDIPLDFAPLWSFTLGESVYWDVFIIGVQNTVLISIAAIIGATTLGFFVGVLRLSPNWLLAKLAACYIEVFRNTPLLLQLLCWNFAVFLPLVPAPRESWILGEGFILNKAGLYFPQPELTATGAAIFIVAMAVAVVAIVVMKKWSRKRQEKTGQSFPLFLASAAVVVVALFLALLLSGGHVSFDYAQLKGLNYRGGGRVPLIFIALWVGLTTYTAAFIAENVRGGINAVDKGQTEAARSLGLRHGANLKLVVIPQAMRVIIPPTISQFLNATKNSSLAVAIGYPDLVNVWAGISLNQTGQSLVIIAMTIGVYWTLSLLTSVLLNWYNTKVQLQGR
ncbi:MAG: amino acid ABC transporter permease [Gammaproteobacteria bacterium]